VFSPRWNNTSYRFRHRRTNIRRISMITDETIAALRELGAATVYEAQGGRGAVDSGIKPIDPNSRLAGRALTIDTAPADNLMFHYALLKARPGDVLVVDAKGFLEAGPWGDILTEAALARGIAGLVTNGAVRDATSIEAMGFPVFCRGLSIKGTGKNHLGRVGGPVILGGVNVQPGDVVVGDRDGVVVVPAAEADTVLAKAQRRAEKEEDFRQAIREGRSTVELLGLADTLRQLGLD
jgi:4-hydroxy-4-methyl-2-oxoglutarate aldolase